MISKSVKAKRRKYKDFYKVLNAIRLVHVGSIGHESIKPQLAVFNSTKNEVRVTYKGYWIARISSDLKNKPQVCELIERYNTDFTSRTEVEAYVGVHRRLLALKKVEYNIRSDRYLYTTRINQGIPLNLFKA